VGQFEVTGDNQDVATSDRRVAANHGEEIGIGWVRGTRPGRTGGDGL